MWHLLMLVEYPYNYINIRTLYTIKTTFTRLSYRYPHVTWCLPSVRFNLTSDRLRLNLKFQCKPHAISRRNAVRLTLWSVFHKHTHTALIQGRFKVNKCNIQFAHSPSSSRKITGWLLRIVGDCFAICILRSWPPP